MPNCLRVWGKAMANKSIISLRWFNPYTSPPADVDLLSDGRCCWACTVLDRRYEDEIRQKNEPVHTPGDGWASSWSPFYEPAKQWSSEAKARVRKGRLQKRLQKKFPLFADLFVQSEMQRRPDYFDPVAIAAAGQE